MGGGLQLVAERVTLTYREGIGGVSRAVDDVRLVLRGPGYIGIAGPSGSGKSSLLYLLAGLKRPTTGQVVALGENLSLLSAAQRCRLRRRHFGFVFQQPFLIRFLTVGENVLVGSPTQDGTARRQARELLERLGLGGLAHRLPHQLSGGQRQRVAVARALMNAPLVVFADEPTAALDHATGVDLMGLLHEYRRERGALMVVVTHDETILEGADAVIRMWDGRVARVDGASSGPGEGVGSTAT